MKEIDARGNPCPQPVLMAKKALKTGRPFNIIVDGSGQAENVQRAVSRAGATAIISRMNGFDSIEVKPSEAVAESNPTHGKLAVSVQGDAFGNGGDRELEEVLCRMYFHTLTEMNESVPDTILFYDRGVMLTSAGSPVLDDLKVLEGRGTRILVCGTCLKHFKIMNEHSVGTVSNMYEIAVELGRSERHYSI